MKGGLIHVMANGGYGGGYGYEAAADIGGGFAISNS